MDIVFKGRRTEVQDRFRHHAEAKLGKIGKLDRKAIRVDVEVSAERNPRQSDRRERVELTIRSRGPVIRAEAAADDRYVALDRALAKLEMRLRRSSERRKTRRAAPLADRAVWAAEEAGPPGTAQEVRPEMQEAERTATPGGPEVTEQLQLVEPGSLAGPAAAGGLIPIEMEGDGPLVVREKQHSATPMSIDQALLEMELVGHDFYLFRDADSGYPSVVYRRHGYQYGLIRLVEPGTQAEGHTGIPA